jgi:hypothetical protein
MALRFIFVSQEDLDRENLHQGDILQKTDALHDVIGQAHRYYADAEDYHFYMVLTQSCDLVRRKSKPKTPYITIAAVRPARILIDRLIEQYTFHRDNSTDCGMSEGERTGRAPIFGAASQQHSRQCVLHS